MAAPTVRVEELRLRLQLAAAVEADAARVRAEVERGLVVAVLEEVDRRLHAALGAGAVIRVRRLALRWRVDAGALADAATAARLAAELATDLLAEIDAQPAAERLRPRSASIVVFASAAHVAAARLADLADGRGDAWFHAGAPPAEATWDELVRAGPRAIEEALAYLARMGRVDAAISLAPAAALASIAAAVPAVAAVVAQVRARAAAPPPARDDDAPATPGAPVAAAAEPSPRASPPDPDPPTPSSATSGAPVAAPPIVGPGAPVAASPIVGPGAPAATVADPAAAAPIAIPTRHAGLFYLVGRALEIDLAEALWAIGVVEGDVLAHVARAIVAADDDAAADPAWRWFGGAFEHDPAPPSIPAWAAAEACAAVQHGLGRRLVRFGVVTTPDALATTLDRLAASLLGRPVADPAAAGLVARCAAALACVVAARLGAPPSWPLLRAVTTRPGQLVATDDALHVTVTSPIDLDHRRAGLDQDPGWVPWLGRRLHLAFAAVEVL